MGFVYVTLAGAGAGGGAYLATVDGLPQIVRIAAAVIAGALTLTGIYDAIRDNTYNSNKP